MASGTQWGSESFASQRASQAHLLPNIEDFRKILLDSGVTLTSDADQPHILTQEQALIVRELNKIFETDTHQRCLKFMSCLKYLCKKDKHFKKFLRPTKFQKDSCDSYVSIYQDSLMSIFLKVPYLQDDIIEIILETATAVAMDETQDTSWLRTLLKPLRCLPVVKNGASLSKKVLDILEISTFPCQLEFLEALPEILPDNQCDIAAKQLTNLLDENEQLCGAIVDCLTALNLEAEIRSQIHDRVLARILAGVSLKVYLVLIKFLISDYKSQTLGAILLKIRSSLDNLVGGSCKEKESDKTLVIHYLQSSAVTQKPVAEGWLNTISCIKKHQDHKPIDLVIMFMLHHTSDVRKRVIEGIFRKRVSAGLFKIGLMEKAFEKYMTKQLLKDYIGNITAIGCCLLRFSKDIIVAKFATNLFQILFNHEYTGTIYRGEILSSLISLTSTNDHNTIDSVLKLILSLVAQDHQKVQMHINLLMQFLEKLDSLSLKDVKIVFDILCSLLCGDKAEDSLSGYKDQIYNTIRKQLSCCERTIKHRGIISAIVMIKHTAAVSGDDDSFSIEKSTTSSNTLQGPAREAAQLLELVNCATADNPELLSLYYDQLASILASDECFDKYFLYWLYKKFEDDFETIFLTDNVPDATSDLNFSAQYVLNQCKAINIAGFTACDRDDKILILAPYFRVLRLLHFRQHEHLSEIESLLVCGVILPEVDDPDELDANQIRVVADCLFHCVNWFREIISAFVSEKSNLMQKRVVTRLGHLLEVENKLQLFLKEVPGHNLPLSYFDSVTNITRQLAVKVDGKPARKKLKTKSTSIINDGNATVNTQEATKAKKGLIQAQKVQFRELDTDLIRLIRYPLVLDEGSELVPIYLNISQVKFILNDFLIKLKLLTQSKDIGLSHLNDVNPEHLIKDCVRIVANINKFLQTMVKKIQELLEQPEETCYSDEASDIKICFGSILQIFFLVFQWPGFQHTGNVDLLKNILKSSRNDSSKSLESVGKLSLEFALKVSGYAPCCLCLNHAVSVIKIMETLSGLCLTTTNEFQTKITATAQFFLSKRWYDLKGKLDQGQACNQNVDVILKAYLKYKTVQDISDLIASLVNDIAAIEPKDGFLNNLPAIDHKNFHVLYLNLCNSLTEAIKTEIQALSNMGHLSLWLSVASTMTNLMTIANTLQTRNLACFLKKTIGILKIFLSHGIPILEIMLRTQATEVTQILKTIQTTTRFLHHLCCQSKMTRDASVVPYIPSFKQTIESLIYRVKAALMVNNCPTAFWFGNLRNRDLHGEDIVSQSTVVSSENDTQGDDDDQLPSDDDQIIINGDQSDNESMESEVFN